MPLSRALLVIALGCVTSLVVGCSGRAIDSHDAAAGSGGSGEASGAAGASAGASPTSAGTSPGGAAGAAGSTVQAGAGGMTLREPEKHRSEATACDPTRPSMPPNAPPDGDPNWVTCHSHAECTDGANGRCSGNGRAGYRCTYDLCFTDSDCPTAATGESQLCQCDGGYAGNNVCLPGNCRVDADCGNSGYCSPSLGACGNYSGVVGYFCHTQEDECLDDADCSISPNAGYCAFMPVVGRWQCSTAQCVG